MLPSKLWLVPLFLAVLGGNLIAQQVGGETPPPPPAGQKALAPAGADDAAIYADLLESLLARDFARAEADRKRLAEEWPGSPLALRASEMMARYAPKRDTSGIVPFYVGNLITGVAVSVALPTALLGQPISDQVTGGLLYLGGAAAGLGSAWLMSRDGEFSLAKEIWIETVAASAAGTWFFLYDAWVPVSVDDEIAAMNAGALSARSRIELLGLTAGLVAGRGATWAILGDSTLSLGRAAMAAQAESWALFYTFAVLQGIFQVQDNRILSTSLVVAADGALTGGAIGWDGLHWSAFRSGLVSVGGLAGLLFASGVNMIVSGLVPYLDERVVSAMIAGGALAGQATAVMLTDKMESEPAPLARLELSVMPALLADGPALSISGRLSL